MSTDFQQITQRPAFSRTKRQDGADLRPPPLSKWTIHRWKIDASAGKIGCNQRARFPAVSAPNIDPFMQTLPTDPHLALKAVMMPYDTNPVGTVFGGVLLSYIDQAGVVGAVHEIARQGWPRQPLVTVAMNA